MIARTPRFLSVVLMAVLLVTPTAALACGPFTLSAVFTFTVHPEYPLEKFARGEIGVVQPSYARSYLYVAYRHLIGASFTQSEQKALVDLWRERLDHHWDPAERDGKEQWLAVRKKISGLNEAPEFDVYRNREKPNEYETYLNCQKDSFETAVETLDARLKQFGADDAGVKQWVEAQDLVFSNCSEGTHIPAPLTSNATALLQADRQYQIAAANFYAGNLDEAKTIFESIAVDDHSPWRVVAPYLIARTFVRKASLGPAETKMDALTEAESRLNRILSDRSLVATHSDARRLSTIVRIRLHPEERLNELARLLVAPTENGNLKQDLWDYTLLLDRYESDDETQPARKPAQVDDLSDWILTLQAGDEESIQYSIAKWKESRSVPWLIAALSKVDARHASAPELARGAAQIPATSPAFASAAFHLTRLDIEAGRVTQAQSRLDDLLKRYQDTLSASSLNLIRHQRMMASQTLDDFLIYSQRVPAALSWDDDGREIPAEPSELSADTKESQAKPLFDLDATEVLNWRMPLALLKQASKSNKLPEHLRRDVVQATWLRAVLLGDHTTASTLSPKLEELIPEMKPLLANYLSSRTADAKNFSAIYAWLHFPGLEPVVDTGVGRGANLSEQDSYRDNWWCSSATGVFSPLENEERSVFRARSDLTPIRFLSPAQIAAAEKEFATLRATGAAPNYISRQVVEWGMKNPTDARVPEALHLAVKTTRYGCADKETGRWSKAAYDLLHRRYPRNEWTKQTPYWFKN